MLVALHSLLWLPLLAVALDNGLGLRPQLGFNSWNSFQTKVNETVMRATIDSFVSTGLRDAGFEYVSIDDFWALGRYPNGTIFANPETFPSGIAALADYAHQRGLKFGLYSSNSPKTCGGKPGSFGFEALDARTYASWGIDLLKYDNCGNQHEIGPPERGYSVMRDALNATGRPIFFAACEWAVDYPATWMNAVANTWRTTYDIEPYWECVTSHVDWTNIYADYAGPGGFNDMDILEVGVPRDGGGLSWIESVSHMSLWALMKAPLMVGCDLSTQLCRDALPIFSNKEILAVNQDPLGKAARRVHSTGHLDISKTGRCRSEERPQNTIITPCDSNSALQQWVVGEGSSASGVEIRMAGAMGGRGVEECLQLDTGQGGDCGGADGRGGGLLPGRCNGGLKWDVWMNNAASSLCNDPAACCPDGQKWIVNTSVGTVQNALTSHCLTVHAAGMRNVGLSPCTMAQQGLQTWDFEPLSRGSNSTTGMFVSSAAPGGMKSCLARTGDVVPGAIEVWAGPLANGDSVLLLFNRNMTGSVNITASWADIGLPNEAKVVVRDLWGSKDLGTFSSEFTAEAEEHGVRVFRLRSAKGSGLV